jgi:cardiolipin synthase
MTASAALRRLAEPFAALACLLTLLAGCAQLPIIPDLAPTQGDTLIQVRGARGQLSQRETANLLKRLEAEVPDASALQRHLAIEQTVSGSALYTGNRVSILRDGPQTFAAMFAAIHGAQHFLYLEYYIFEDVSFDGEQLGDLLLQRQAQGVQINIVYDSVGSLGTPGAFFDRLQAAGIRLRQFNPINPFTRHFALNARDHRKLLVADGRLAIIGGVNLSTDYQSSGPSETQGAHAHQEPWHDTDLQIEGPAVSELERLFEQHWLQQGGVAAELRSGEPAPSATGNEVVRVIGSEGGRLRPRYYGTLLSAVRSATARIWVNAAYFVPTHAEKIALEHAAERGVDVRLLLPSHSDSPAALAVGQSRYSDLLGAGVKIYERADGILHSKTVVMDGVWSIIGSSNFDHRSVLFNDELDAVIIGTHTGAQLESYFDQDLQHAAAVDLAQWRRRPLTRKLREQFWRLWEQLL